MMGKGIVKYLVGFFTLILCSCGKCELKRFTEFEKYWINLYKKNDVIKFSNGFEIAAFKVVEVRNFITPCNKIELSEFQYENYDVEFVNPLNKSSFIFFIQKNTFEHDFPDIVFDNLHTNENMKVLQIDTVLCNRKYTNIYFFNETNTDDISKRNGKPRRYINFFCDYNGLLAYTTIENEVFVRFD